MSEWSVIPTVSQAVAFACKHLERSAPVILPHVISAIRKVLHGALKLGSGGDDSFWDGWPGYAYESLANLQALWLILMLMIIMLSLGYGVYQLWNGQWPYAFLLVPLAVLGIYLSRNERRGHRLRRALQENGVAVARVPEYSIQANVDGRQLKGLTSRFPNVDRVSRYMTRNNMQVQLTLDNRRPASR